MRIRKLLQDAVGGALGFVGMVVALVRGDKEKTGLKTSRFAEMEPAGQKGKEGTAPGKQLAVVKKKTVKKQVTAAAAAPARAPKKGVPAKLTQGAKKPAPATKAKGAKKAVAAAAKS